MGRLRTPRAIMIALVGTVGCWCPVAFSADDSAGFVPRFYGSQIMIYVSRTIGARGAGGNTFGIRYERAAPGSADPAARFCAPLIHRTLIDLQMARGLSPRMLFGPRVTWDLGQRQLGPTSLATRAWPMSLQVPTGAMLADRVP